MKPLRTEPSSLILDRVYQQSQVRPVVIDGHCGVIEYAGGGWGNVAVIARFGGVTLTKSERESDDYEQDCDECPGRLETYDWQHEGDDTYYATLSDALAHNNGSNRTP